MMIWVDPHKALTSQEERLVQSARAASAYSVARASIRAGGSSLDALAMVEGALALGPTPHTHRLKNLQARLRRAVEEMEE